MIVYRNINCSFGLLHRFLHSQNWLTIMVCLDLTFCLSTQFCRESNQIWLIRPFLKDTALDIIFLLKYGSQLIVSFLYKFSPSWVFFLRKKRKVKQKHHTYQKSVMFCSWNSLNVNFSIKEPTHFKLLKNVRKRMGLKHRNIG